MHLENIFNHLLFQDSEILQELWRNLVFYTTHLRKCRENEAHHSQFRLLRPTYEEHIDLIERHLLVPLLCSLELYASQLQLTLPQNTPIQVTQLQGYPTNHHIARNDIYFFVVIDNFLNDYLKFATNIVW